MQTGTFGASSDGLSNTTLGTASGTASGAASDANSHANSAAIPGRARVGAQPAVTHVVVPGTFDPVTYGHLDVIVRARRFCPKVTVAVAPSVAKHGTGPAFGLDERVGMVVEALADIGAPDDIEVRPLEGLLVDFCHQIGAGGVVKGLRAMTDFEYELQQADLNSRLAPDIESIFVMSNPEYGYISSSIVRELASFAGDVHLMVPPSVESHLRERYPARDVPPA